MPTIQWPTVVSLYVNVCMFILRPFSLCYNYQQLCAYGRSQILHSSGVYWQRTKVVTCIGRTFLQIYSDGMISDNMNRYCIINYYLILIEYNHSVIIIFRLISIQLKWFLNYLLFFWLMIML